jgi:predicted enzyme related to lactoylglutathione lyase
MPPTSIDKSLRFSVLADPQGAVFALTTAFQ